MADRFLLLQGLAVRHTPPSLFLLLILIGRLPKRASRRRTKAEHAGV